MQALDQDWDYVSEHIRASFEPPLRDLLGGFGHLRANIVQGKLTEWAWEQLNREEGAGRSGHPRQWHVIEPAHYRFAKPRRARRKQRRAK